MRLLVRPIRGALGVVLLLVSGPLGVLSLAQQNSTPLHNILTSKDSDVIQTSIQTLVDNNSFPDDEEYIRKLTTFLDDQKLRPSLREVSAFALGKAGERASTSIPALERALEVGSCREPKSPKLGACWKLQRAAAEALGRIRQNTSDVITSLIKAETDNPNSMVKAFSIIAQAQLDKPKEGVEKLWKALDSSKSVDVQATIAYQLAQMGPTAVDAVPSLINALNHDEKKVVEVSAWALGLIGPDAAKATYPLMGRLRDSSATVRRVSATALQHIGSDDNHVRHDIIEDLSNALRVETEIEAKTAMAVAIAELEDGNQGGARALFDALRSSDERALQQAACIGIAKANPPPNPDIQLLTRISTEEYQYPDVKIAALNAIGHIHQRPNVAIPAILKALAPSSKIRSVRIAAIEALGQFADLGKYGPEALKTLGDASQDEQTRLISVKSLERLASSYRSHFAQSRDRADFSLRPAIELALKDVQYTLQKEPKNPDYIKSEESLTSALDALNRRRWLERLAAFKPIAWPLAGLFAYVMWISILYFVVLRLFPLRLVACNEFLRGLGQVKLFNVLAVKLRDILLWNSYKDSRVLSAWIEAHCFSAKETFVHQYIENTRTVFLSLPVAIAGQTYQQLDLAVLRTVCSHKNWFIRILGEGGVGKTTIAYQMALWGLDSDSGKRLIRDRRMIPVVLERAGAPDLLKDVVTFKRAVRGKLQNLIRDPIPIPEWLCESLLRDRRILVIVDGLSEISAATEDPLPLSPDYSIAALLVTSRSDSLWAEVSHVDIRPLRVDSNHLSAFINAYLGQSNMLPDDKLFEACRRLATMVGVKSITPLLARMYAEQLVGRSRGLPENIPDLVVGYLSALNRDRKTGQPEHSTIQRAAELAAWECCKATFSSGYVKRDRVCEALSSFGELSEEHLEYLETRLQLIRKIPPTNTYIEFSFDRIADYLAGFWLAQELKNDRDWQKFLQEARQKCKESVSVGDFLVALVECCEYIGFKGAPSTLVELHQLSQNSEGESATTPVSVKRASAGSP
jgi:HEAT repeat protein